MKIANCILIPVLSFFSALACGCSREEPAAEKPRLVLEGWIDSGGGIRVMLSSSAVVDSNEGKVADLIARWGKVTVNDGESEVILTGKREESIGFPFFWYYSDEIRGVPGREYHVTATYGGECVTASSRMPESGIAIDEVFSPGSGRVAVSFTEPDSPGCFAVAMCRYASSKRMFPSAAGIWECKSPGNIVTLDVTPPWELGKTPKAFSPGDEIVVGLASVDAGAYGFWKVFCEIATLGTSPFFGNAPDLPSLVDGGYGVFSARIIDTRPFTVP